MADIFACLADGTRRELLQRLLGSTHGSGEVSVGELVSSLGISQPTVSKHLKVLREHGLVSVREEGQHRYYRLDPAPLGELGQWLAPFLEPSGGAPAASVTAEQTAFAAWAGAELAGDKVGRAAAETAHAARVALEAAQEKLEGAKKSLHVAQERAQEGLVVAQEKLQEAASRIRGE